MGAGRQSRLISLVLRLYPTWWRERHGDEAAEIGRLLTSDGVPTASVAWDYLTSAVRERVAGVVRSRWCARAAALVASGSLAAAAIAVSSSPAPASALNRVTVRAPQAPDGARALAARLRSHHFAFTVRQVPVAGGRVGSIVAAWGTASRTSGAHIIGRIKGDCADGSFGCTVGLQLPANFSGHITVLVGAATGDGPSR